MSYELTCHERLECARIEKVRRTVAADPSIVEKQQAEAQERAEAKAAYAEGLKALSDDELQAEWDQAKQDTGE